MSYWNQHKNAMQNEYSAQGIRVMCIVAGWGVRPRGCAITANLTEKRFRSKKAKTCIVYSDMLLLVEGGCRWDGGGDKTTLQKELSYLLKLPHHCLGIYCSTKENHNHRLLHWSSQSVLQVNDHVTLYTGATVSPYYKHKLQGTMTTD